MSNNYLSFTGLSIFFEKLKSLFATKKEIGFTGTFAEVTQALSAGEIEEGTIVNITDDFEGKDSQLVLTGETSVIVGNNSSDFQNNVSEGNVVFNQEFSTIPIIMVYTKSSEPRNNMAWIVNVTTKGFSYGIYRFGNNTPVNIYWKAIGKAL